MKVLLESNAGSTAGKQVTADRFIEGTRRFPNTHAVNDLRELAATLQGLADRAKVVAESLSPANRPPRVYVSGPSKELERCEIAMNMCRQLGAEISFDWTLEIRRNHGASTPPNPEAQLQVALLDLEGVARCDAMLFLDGLHASPGRWVELGAAWMAAKPIVSVVGAGCPEYLWHRLAVAAPSDELGCSAVLEAARRVSQGF